LLDRPALCRNVQNRKKHPQKLLPPEVPKTERPPRLRGPESIEKIQRVRRQTRDRQADYSRRQAEERDPPARIIAAALLASLATVPSARRAEYRAITSDMLHRLTSAGYLNRPPFARARQEQQRQDR
jgi:hypothetical protein